MTAPAAAPVQANPDTATANAAPAVATPAAPAAETQPTSILGAPPAAPAPAAQPEVAPETQYEIKLPEGVTIPDEVKGQVVEFAKAGKLSPEAAQKAAELVAAQRQAALAEVKAGWTKQQEAWNEQLLADPELGGPNLNETRERSNRALRLIDPQGELLRDLMASGTGSCPSLVKAMVMVDRLTSEDRSVRGEPPPPSDPGPKAFFPNSPELR